MTVAESYIPLLTEAEEKRERRLFCFFTVLQVTLVVGLGIAAIVGLCLLL